MNGEREHPIRVHASALIRPTERHSSASQLIRCVAAGSLLLVALCAIVAIQVLYSVALRYGLTAIVEIMLS